ncbi:hypothetical protein EJB05_25604, partial [Eragrostis curvula]
MAAVLEALLPYVMKMITNMAEEEVGLLLGVHGEMEKLGRNLGNVKAFLADAERRRIRDELVQGWVRMLKGVMYDATDVLELGQLKAEERRESKLGRSMEKKMPDCCQPFLFCLRNPVFAHKIGSRIKELNQRLEEIHKEAAKFNFIANLSSYPEQRPEAAEYSRGHRMTSEFIPSAVVGEQMERDTRLLVQELITTDENHVTLKVVSIVGMGGMGKTTLAQKIFKDTTIDEHFKTKIWLSITQQFNELELLRSAIKHAGGDLGVEQDNTLLTRTLTNTLSANKFLLVLDDMWSARAWESILGVPVTNASYKQPGSRVLVTTRFQDLAPQMHQPFYLHRVNPLDEDDAWSLLKNQFSQPSNQVARVDHLKDTGMKIIKKCGGLPLAIKIVGGLLRTKPQTEQAWEAILNHHAWSSDGLPHELDRRLYLSYEHLSPQLKQCFIYCSLFPKGKTIVKVDVTSMWISEGFIQPQGGNSSHDDDDDDGLEEVAEGYFQELIKRNLIEPTDQITGHECIMHDVVRFFAEFIAREESLVVVEDKLGIATCGDKGPLRRLCIRQSITEAEWAILQRQRSLRTLIILSGTNLNLGDAFSNFSCLRVISIQGASSDSLVQFLCQLKHLRNLDLKDTDISRLPDDINKMKFLRYISLVDCKKLDHLPSTIVKLQQLRLLDISGCNVTVVPKGFGRLTNLRSLYSFPVHMDMDGNGGWCSLEEIGPLSHLRNLEIKGLENVSEQSWAEKAMISSKMHLTYLVLNCSSSRYLESQDELEKQQQQKATEEVFEKLYPPTCVEQLWVEGYFGRHLPHWMMIPATSAFKSLRYLTLKDVPCCTQLPDGLGQLPSLESLVIEDAPAIKSVRPEFQASSSVAVGGGVAPSTSAAFPSLTNLCLEGLCEWEEWEWEEQGEDVTADAMMAMPALKKLTIDNCKLGRLPPGLASSKRHALRRLNLYELSKLTCVENFPSVVELDVFDCPELKRIRGLSRLQRIRIIRCPNLEALEGVPALDSIWLRDNAMETLPEYLRGVNPRHLELTCSEELCESLSPGSSEWDKISHIRHTLSTM